ncbi:MAG: aminotransferase class I/II-fold pyridoxal phosphate-dependent enzyme [Rhodothermales bacterium]|nr:aminotransferase class I/II-fold pyridoxal phosphate-dependent enzyme [Rhodothermales bacterium]MBO6781067.1 aminotransferase class I/II-fold pyridoxal phosphate-dependent enzyme [Rhodothermales bacterium]
MIPLAIPNMAGNEARYLAECVETNFVSSVGRFVTRLEEQCAGIAGTRRAVATSAGTTGLQLALLGVGVRPGDVVITPALSFIATANAVRHCGAEPWFVDIDADSWSLSPDQLSEALEAQGRRTADGWVHRPSGRRIAAILPVHLNGIPALMQELRAIADRFDVPLVADAAAAIGASLHHGQLFDLADASVFSFNGNKTVTAGGGGCVVTNDEQVADRMKHLSTTARTGPDYDHDEVGFNFRMTNLQAAVGCAQLEQVETFLAHKRTIQERYDRAFAGTLGASPHIDYGTSACWLSVAMTSGLDETRSLIAGLAERGVMARTFFKPLNRQIPYVDAPSEATPVSDRIWGRVLTLPCSTGLTEAEQETVIAAVHDAVGARVEAGAEFEAGAGAAETLATHSDSRAA